jgi:[protein-PII] uridylyltransferase
MYHLEELGINVITAKIHSSKYKVRDSFLMEKQNKICNNIEKIYESLSNDKK